jgi:SulP family sulfate permease
MQIPVSDKKIWDGFFPFISWFRGYDFSDFRSDLLSGVIVAGVLIPQSMAYTLLAGLPYEYGLYAAAFTPLIAAMWGSFRQLATGPISIMSLLVLTTLSPLAAPGSAGYIELAILLAFMIGIIKLFIGIFKLSIIMSFISHSAVKGFTSAVALIAILTQLPNFLGLDVSWHRDVYSTSVELFQELSSIHILSGVIGMAAFVIIHFVKKLKRTVPAAFIAVCVVTLIVYIFNLNHNGVVIIGKIPDGLPSFQNPLLNFEIISSLIVPAIVIALISFVETYSVRKEILVKTKQKIDTDQEFIGQGLANLVGSFFQSYPVSGSFSRTAINYSTGAKTGIANVVSSIIVILFLIFFTPIFTYIPKASLAAIVISSVLMLFHPKQVFDLWKKNRNDGYVAIAIFVLALITRPDYALLIGVSISLIFLLWKTMHQRIVRVTKDTSTGHFVNADAYDRPCCPQILHVRPDNSLYFGNAEHTIESIIKRLDRQKTPIKFLVFDFLLVPLADMTGIDAIRELNEYVKLKGITLALLDLHGPVESLFIRSGFIDEINKQFLLKTMERTIETLYKAVDHEYCKKCPYKLYIECRSE